ncbi:hypothetical protein [Sphingobacterium luzhongxinii]|uniref:hypothetical protein n=1 Tax=Sphingobacterium luzhongxinii TaxID=2654181 RepID=UPI0013DC576C|nr:hypothetical protein [Sphingobacterium sp. xlx-183]
MKINLNNIGPADLIAAYAALMSTILAIREIARTRMRFSISYYQTGEADVDNVIVLYNDSSKSVTIEGYEILTSSRKTIFRLNRRSIHLGNEGDLVLFTILPFETRKIPITDQYKFVLRRKERLYIKLWCMGRKRPITKLVYS